MTRPDFEYNCEYNPEGLRRFIKLIILLILLCLSLMFFTSCEKYQDHCWRCWYTEISQREGFEANTRTVTFDTCNISHDEILKFDAEMTTESEYFENGEKYSFKTKCHCMKKTCW